MAVPASYNDIGVDAAVRDHIGPVWYRRSFFVPTDWRGSAVVVRVGAASHHATLYVNGVEVCRHQGGFLPFEGEATARWSSAARTSSRCASTTASTGGTLPRRGASRQRRARQQPKRPGYWARACARTTSTTFSTTRPASFGLRAQALALRIAGLRRKPALPARSAGRHAVRA